MLEVSFGAGPDPVADVAHRRAEQRRTLNRPGLELSRKHFGRDSAQLDGSRDQGIVQGDVSFNIVNANSYPQAHPPAC